MFSFDDPAFLASMVDPLWIVAGAAPTLDLPFARNRSLVDAVTGQSLITYTRTSTGTYVNSNGVITTAASNEPRFDHNPTTGESLGLLVEEQRPNISPYSRFESGQWTFTAASVGSSTKTAIDGATVTAFLADNTNTAHRVVRSITGSYTVNDIYTQSFYVAKPANSNIRGIIARVRSAVSGQTSGQSVIIAVSDQGEDSTYSFSYSSPFGVNPPPAITSANFRAEGAGNKWVRISIATAIASVNSSLIQWDIGFGTAGESGSGTANSELFIDAVQLEPGDSATSYVPTTTAAATRAASFADLISSAIANNIRSFYVEFRSPAVGVRGVVSLNDSTANERASMITSGADPRLVVVDGGIEQANINGGTVSAGARTRIAVRINENNFAVSVNGGAVVTDTSGTLPTVDRIMLGRTQAGEFLNSRIARFTGWNELLSNATLQALAGQ